jgi:YVTN family beta-propeller protein
MKLRTIIRGAISPKSVVCSGNGLAFAQNMMYRHTVTVYDRNFRLVKTLPDTVNLAAYGIKGYSGTHKGSPVECAFTPDGRYAWVSNYQMYGKGFNKPGNDRVCAAPGTYDSSFLYRIDTETLRIDRIARAGAVPKYVAVTPDSERVLVTNWCSGDLVILDADSGKMLKRVPLGRMPRGIAVDEKTGTIYVAVMGSSDIAVVNGGTYAVSWLRGVGRNPRHLCISPDGQHLYATLNGEGNVIRIDTNTKKVTARVATGRAPRSMVLGDGNLYVVNYESDSMSKVRTSDMKVLETVKTSHHPIGISYDPPRRQVWVACYTGSIHVFDDAR